MKFPNVEVQPHWLVTLERAAEEMPNYRWVCCALDNDVEPKIEMEVIAAISKAITPAGTVNSWHCRETGSRLQSAHKYRTAWLSHTIEQCRAMQGDCAKETE